MFHKIESKILNIGSRRTSEKNCRDIMESISIENSAIFLPVYSVLPIHTVTTGVGVV